MARRKQAPWGFKCEYKHCCPFLEGWSTQGMWHSYQYAKQQEHEQRLIREQMNEEINQLLCTVRQQEREMELLKAENKRLHQQKFKPNKKAKRKNTCAKNSGHAAPSGKNKPKGKTKEKKRGAPKGHPPWSRPVPEHIDRSIEVDAPTNCPHCNQATDPAEEIRSYIQEDIVWNPRVIVSEYIHHSAWCSGCNKSVIQALENQIPNAPIGPNTKSAALFLRHEIKLSTRKIQQVMKVLFGIDFVPASIMGFEKRAYNHARELYEDLIEKVRHSDIVHADETHWREDGRNSYVWYAGNQQIATYHIDQSRSSASGKILLGNTIEGLLVTDAYAGYNAINVTARQTCLAHLIRKSDELLELHQATKKPESHAVTFCTKIGKLLRLICRLKIPFAKKEKEQLKKRLYQLIYQIAAEPTAHKKTETFRKRFLPESKEHPQLLAFIDHDGPPTNNHAEQSLRPLVIFRKICMGTRSQKGSENIAIFSSIAQTAKLQNAPLRPILNALLTGTTLEAQKKLFIHQQKP